MKKMFCDTKIIAEPNAQMTPIILDAEVSKLHASMTPNVKGSNEKYVLGVYFTPKSRAYAATVNNGESACRRESGEHYHIQERIILEYAVAIAHGALEKEIAG